jgi:tetratricopeptide (TPR) repeat protein
MVPEPAHRLLMLRGIAEMQQQELQAAVVSFTKLIEAAPDLSEAWNKRATAHWLLGNFPASLADICETVKREPRHFGAYSGLGMIRAQMGEHARAAAAFGLAKKWNPHIVGIDAEIERQKAEAGGQVADDPLGCGQRTASR